MDLQDELIFRFVLVPQSTTELKLPLCVAQLVLPLNAETAVWS